MSEPPKPKQNPMVPIPVSAGALLSRQYGYDQVIIIGRRVGKGVGSGEHVTTYGRNPEHCSVAARAGNYLKHKVMGWPEDPTDMDQAAKVIDRLLVLLASHDYNAVDDAIAWLRKTDHPGRRLTVSTRDRMEAAEE